ncbi:MAG TPA: glycosyltransferase [Nocardioidaceae bacterium]|nr:glycosyltransferase [Nocardioidaceae bacterium]
MAQLRILHVSEVHWGGVVTLLDHFVAEQVRAGQEVHVLAPDGMRTFPGAEQRVWRIDRSRPWTFGSAVRDLRRAVKEIQPDVVHLHSFVAGLIGRLPYVRTPVARADSASGVVYQPHAWSFDLFTRRSVGNAVRRWERWAARSTDMLVANCDDEIDEGRAIGIDVPARALGVAVDVERFHPVDEAERDAYRAELGVDAKHVLLCLGRLVRQKGQDLLLPAWERDRPPDTALVLLGPGDQEPLAALAPTQWGRSVFAVGEQDDVRPWLWACDALVLPSRYETVALVVAEAMSCGRPVIATAVNGARDTILGGSLPTAGAVVELSDMDALIEQATRRLDDRELWAAEAAAGRERAEVLFSPPQVADRLEAAYRDAIETPLSQS